MFVDKFDKSLFYYTAKDGQDELTTYLRGMVGQFAEAIEGFGGKTRAALDASNHDPAALAHALAEDLTAAGEHYGLWFDELDRMRIGEDNITFFQNLAAALPDGSQLILCTRQLPQRPWRDLLVAESTVILNDYDVPIESEEGKPLLEVYALGAGNALINGEAITSWDGALPRNLFFFFVDRPLVTRDEVFATFWPDLSVKEATNVFHVTKRKISERLDHELTSYNSGFYIPSGQMDVHYDAVEFLEAIEQASTLSDEEAFKNYRHALNLYRGDFLSGLDMDWAVERRQALKTSYAQALIALGRICKRQDRNEEALGYFLRALHETPEREDIHREVMALYVKLGRPTDAKAQYRRLAAELQADLGISPSRESRELYESIQ
ncbi:MAG: bacterial transcriptional activator domain-containing protein [Anaerolineae bacterium]|nr:bacterial transcriptional activator domain-containing protein [Anaerolineae bacterium]